MRQEFGQERLRIKNVMLRWAAGGAEALEKQCGLALFVLRCFGSFKKNDKASGALEDNYDSVNPTHICRTETTSDSSR
jgi:hypothetical protein